MWDKNSIIEEDLKNIVQELGTSIQELNRKTILITGGAGFLGKYFVSTLDYLNKNVLENPCKVIIIDNFITGLKDSIKENNNIQLIQHDISKPIQIKDNIDYIIHAASIASPVFYNKFRLETIDVGFLGTKNLLEIAKEKNIKSFLFLSSSEIYGNPNPGFIPTNEEYLGNVSCIGPRSPYDEPKRIGETLCMTYGDMFNLPIKIARPFNIFGPGMRLDDGRAVPNFVISILKGEKVPIYGDGRNTRTFCYISDAITGFFKILLSDHNREVFNIGNDEQEIQMKHLAEIIHGLIENNKSEIETVKNPAEVYSKKSDPNRRCPDLTKIRTMLGYNPNINLVTGLRRFLTWANKELKAQETASGFQNKCRVCGHKDLKSIISLGKSPLANSLLSDVDLDKEEEMFPLEMMYCDNCNLCQLSYVVDPKKMFKHYLYVTSTTDTFKNHFKDMAATLYNQFNLKNNSLVVDVGSNDGILLKRFRDLGVRTIGVEPAENICKIAREEGIDTLCGFFDKDIVNDIIKIKGKADIVTANNVFAHVGDIERFTKNVKDLLKDTGAFIIEVQYLLDTIQKLTFDNIYHEHLSYFSISSLNEFFSRQDMEIFKVEHVGTHGGSVRVYIQKKGGEYLKDGSVNGFLEKERECELNKFETYQKFAKEINEIKDKIRGFIMQVKNEGKRIIGYGAPAKATTLLNFYNLDNHHIEYIIEDNPLKQGKIIPGVRIPIKNKTAFEKAFPDYILILAWNFAEEILKKNQAYKEKGTKFLIPSPQLRVI